MHRRAALLGIGAAFGSLALGCGGADESTLQIEEEKEKAERRDEADMALLRAASRDAVFRREVRTKYNALLSNQQALDEMGVTAEEVIAVAAEVQEQACQIVREALLASIEFRVGADTSKFEWGDMQEVITPEMLQPLIQDAVLNRRRMQKILEEKEKNQGE